MALIECPECGKMISERAKYCPNCGFPIYYPEDGEIDEGISDEELEEINNEDNNDNSKMTETSIGTEKGYWSNGRLAIGIISIVLFAVISMQSCVVGAYNTMAMNGEISGTIGFFLAIFMLISGILGICTRNSKQWTGAIICTVFYWLGAIMSIGSSGIYADLPIWGIISFLFGLVFMISAINTRKRSDKAQVENQEEEENYNGISDIIITVIAILIFYPAGIIIMWYGRTFNKTVRIVITCVFVALTLLILI